MTPPVSSSSEDPLGTPSDTMSDDGTITLRSVKSEPSDSGTLCVELLDSELAYKCWKTAYANLKAYVEKHEKLPTSRKCAWISKQRALYKKEKLYSWQIEELESIKGWTWDYRMDAWYRIYDKVKVIIENKLPIKGSRYYKWYIRQRKDYKEGDLEREKIDALERIKNWKWAIAHNSWDIKFKQVVELYRLDKENALRLECTWISRQRKRYNDGSMSDYEKRAIETSFDNWSWDNRKIRWQNGYDEIMQYVTERGYFPVRYKNNWLKWQVRAYKSGNMDKSRMAELEKIPGWKKYAGRIKKPAK